MPFFEFRHAHSPRFSTFPRPVKIPEDENRRVKRERWKAWEMEISNSFPFFHHRLCPPFFVIQMTFERQKAALTPLLSRFQLPLFSREKHFRQKRKKSFFLHFRSPLFEHFSVFQEALSTYFVFLFAGLVNIQLLPVIVWLFIEPPSIQVKKHLKRFPVYGTKTCFFKKIEFTR